MAIHTQRHTYDPSALLTPWVHAIRALQAHRLPAPETARRSRMWSSTTPESSLRRTINRRRKLLRYPETLASTSEQDGAA